MVDNLIVALIVLAAAWYVLRKYLPRSLRGRLFGKADQDGGCGSGCGSCKSGCEPGADTAPAPGQRRVIKLHSR